MQTGSDEDEENLGDDRNISSLEIWMKKQANIQRHDVSRDNKCLLFLVIARAT